MKKGLNVEAEYDKDTFLRQSYRVQKSAKKGSRIRTVEGPSDLGDKRRKSMGRSISISRAN
jgi:hypothetical protein